MCPASNGNPHKLLMRNLLNPFGIERLIYLKVLALFFCVLGVYLLYFSHLFFLKKIKNIIFYVTTPIVRSVYPFNFHIKGKWSIIKKISLRSPKFLTKFQQSLPYTGRSQVINNLPCTYL